VRPGQLLHRVRYTLRRAWWERNAELVDRRYRTRAQALPALRWDHPGLAAVAAFRRDLTSADEARATADAALEGRFTFLSRTEAFGAEVDWFRSDLDTGTRLWKTLLHEFSYAEALARVAAEGSARHRARLFDLAHHWRISAPIGCEDFARDAWNARASANRLIHWAVAGATLGLSDDDPDAAWLGREIGMHGLFLRDNLELDLRGNHLFRDAVGLVFAHTLVGGVPDALPILEQQVREQVLADGGHLERAPMYHAVCTKDVLEVHLLLGDAAPAWLTDALARMTGFLEDILLGDGEIPLLGDGWLGEVDTPALLAAARARVVPEPPAADARASGLVPLRVGPWRLTLRAGPHGPDYMLGHAHADLLAFDLSADETRVLTDTGTRLYDAGPERDYLRSTQAHNTVQLDDEEQLEAWGSFRVGRRGRASVRGQGEAGPFRWVAASHDAYRWRPGRPMHHRLIALGEQGGVVLDWVDGSGVHRVASRLHRHPDGAHVRVVAIGDPALVEQAPLQERFGETRPMARLVVEAETSLPWAGGWLFGDLAQGQSGLLEHDGASLSLEVPEHAVGLRWTPGAPASDAVRFALPPAPGAAN
jgi:uncharacterized heparinase superfamily protein